MFFDLYVKNTQCPRGEIGRHKGLKNRKINLLFEKDKSLIRRTRFEQKIRKSN